MLKPKPRVRVREATMSGFVRFSASSLARERAATKSTFVNGRPVTAARVEQIGVEHVPPVKQMGMKHGPRSPVPGTPRFHRLASPKVEKAVDTGVVDTGQFGDTRNGDNGSMFSSFSR